MSTTTIHSVCQTHNVSVCDFYMKNSWIDFEKVNICVVDLLKNLIEDNTESVKGFSSKNEYNQCETILNDRVISFLNEKLLNTTVKNAFQTTGTILRELYPYSQIKNVPTHIPGTNSNKIFTRGNKSNILFNDSEGCVDVATDVMSVFSSNINECGCNGIFVSHTNNILDKTSYQIDITNNNNVIIYIPFAEYKPHKIKIAVDIIDNLSDKFANLSCAIPKESLDSINKEFQFFLAQKETIVRFIKETHKTLLCKVEDIKFNCLDKFLSAKYCNVKNENIYKCDLCSVYTSNTLKGMAAHKRGCKRKIKPLTGPHMLLSSVEVLHHDILDNSYM